MTVPSPTNIARWNISAANDVDALDRYRDGLADWYGATGFEEAALPRFFTDNMICQFGDYVVGRGRSIGQVLVRGVHEIRRSQLDGVVLLLDLAGLDGDIDGVRVGTAEGWWLLRASNTQDVLVARCEGTDETALDGLKRQLATQLRKSGIHPPAF